MAGKAHVPRHKALEPAGVQGVRVIRSDVGAAGALGDGLHDDTGPVLATIAGVRDAGGGEVVFPPGTYRLSGSLPAYSGITYRGAGMALSTLQFHGGGYDAFVDGEGATGDSPMADTAWRDLGLDGSALAAAPGKGVYVQHMLHPRWERVLVQNFPSTGFGADFLADAVFAYCRAEGNGRLEEVNDPGGAGIGIGTGASSVEHSLVVGCRCVGNRTWGIFFELQKKSTPRRRSVGNRVVDCYLVSNGFGVGDAGSAGLEVSGCTIARNSYEGVTVNHGSAQGLGIPGEGGLIAENIVGGDGRHGIWLDYTDAEGKGPARYVVRNNIVTGSGGSGICVTGGQESVRDISLIGNELVGSGGSGIDCRAGPGGLRDLVVQGNRVYRNGAGNGQPQILLSGPFSRPRLLDNLVCAEGGTGRGIDLTDVTSLDALVAGNDVRGVAEGIVGGERLGEASRVERNPGHAPPPPCPLDMRPDAAAGPLRHRAGIRPEDVYISGGTQVVTMLDGQVLFSGPGLARLGPGETIQVTWTAPPHVTVRVR